MDVWQNNLDVEMAKIRSVVQQYPYIAMVQFVIHFTALTVYDVYALLLSVRTVTDQFLNVLGPFALDHPLLGRTSPKSENGRFG